MASVVIDLANLNGIVKVDKRSVQMAIANPHALTTVIAGQVSDVLVAVVSESVLR
jgi:hypothetical protein